jgi:hypothetical protein
MGKNDTVDLGMRGHQGHNATSEVDFDEETHLNDILFSSLFPSTKGHSTKLDDNFSNAKTDFYETVKHEQIKCHDKNDPELHVRQCYTLLIAAASEIENGVDNLWKRGNRMDGVIAQTLGVMFPKTCSRVSRRRYTSVDMMATIDTRENRTRHGIYSCQC